MQGMSRGEEMMTMAIQCLLDKAEDNKILIPKADIEAVIKREGPIRALSFNKKEEGLEIRFATAEEVLIEMQKESNISIIEKILSNDTIAPIDFGAGRKGRF